MTQTMIFTTAEIGEAFSMEGGHYYSLTIYTDRRMSARGGLTRGKKAGMIVADSVPELLRLTARLFEQECGWDGVASAIKGAQE